MMTLVRNQPLAEEITQNTFYRTMTSKKTFAQRSGERTWLCSIAKHLAADEYRKTGKPPSWTRLPPSAVAGIRRTRWKIRRLRYRST